MRNLISGAAIGDGCPLLISGGGLVGQANIKDRPATPAAGNVDKAGMAVDDLLDDGQTKAVPALILARGKKGVKDPLQIFFLNTNTVIQNLNMHPGTGAAQG